MNEALTNFISYAHPSIPHLPRIGHLNLSTSTITPLSHISGTPFTTLYEVIESGPTNIISSGAPIALSSVKVLPPLTGRDVLAIGKNYPEHAKEFNASGYDASDKKDMPSHPVVFTKRSTSIIAHGEDVLLFPEFTSTLDYEGEIGVIIGKYAHQVKEKDAMQYVWGYTIINDVTARERQRDHKQFYLGKSGDTYCPMGPIAVPKESLPDVLGVETKINGEVRQRGSSDELIFSIPRLIEEISAAQTMRPGDVIATGTPAGVGFGLKPPQFLKEEDVVEIEVTGLGTLRNAVAPASAANHVSERIAKESVSPMSNFDRTKGVGLVKLPNGKQIHARIPPKSDKQTLLFIHGLGGSLTSFIPLIQHLKLEVAYRCLLYDLEGHGLSPTAVSSVLSIQSYASDAKAVLDVAEVQDEERVTIIAHGMGCVIGLALASTYSQLVDSLIVINPPSLPMPRENITALHSMASQVRESGTVPAAESLCRSIVNKPLAYTAAFQSILSTDPEGFAKGCTALAMGAGSGSWIKAIESKVLIVVGQPSESELSGWHIHTPAKKTGKRWHTLPDVGKWAVFEDVVGLGGVVGTFLGRE